MTIFFFLHLGIVVLGFPGGAVLKNLPANAGDVGAILGSEDSLEEERAAHSSILPWEIPWTCSLEGSQRVRHDRVHTCTHIVSLQCRVSFY